MKNTLTIVIILLCFVSKAQNNYKPTSCYDMFKETVAAERIFFAAFTHADLYARGIYMQDAHDCANNAQALFLKLKPILAKKLSKDEMDNLGGWINALERETGRNVEDLNENAAASFAVVSKIMDEKLTLMAPKILK